MLQSGFRRSNGLTSADFCPVGPTVLQSHPLTRAHIIPVAQNGQLFHPAPHDGVAGPLLNDRGFAHPDVHS